MQKYNQRNNGLKLFIILSLFGLLFFPPKAYADFIIRDQSGNPIFKIDEFGNMTNFGKGKYNFYQGNLPLSPTPAFEVQDASGNRIFQVRNNGDVYMKEDFHEAQSMANASGFIIEVKVGATTEKVAYITNAGHIYLKGYIVAENAPGEDTIRYAFVTRTKYRGDFGTVAYADSECWSAAYNAGLTNSTIVNYGAWVSEENNPAGSRLVSMDGYQFVAPGNALLTPDGHKRLISNGYPLPNMNGATAGQGRFLINAIQYDEWGEDPNSGLNPPYWTYSVFTGTDENGSAPTEYWHSCAYPPGLNSWEHYYGTNCRTGNFLATDATWTVGFGTGPCGAGSGGYETVSRFYAFSQEH